MANYGIIISHTLNLPLRAAFTCVRSGMSPLSMPTCCRLKKIRSYLVEFKKLISLNLIEDHHRIS